MAHLTQTQRAQLEKQLHLREIALRADLQGDAEQDDERRRIVEEARDPADFASATALTDLSHAEAAREMREELGQVSAALRRLAHREWAVPRLRRRDRTPGCAHNRRRCAATAASRATSAPSPARVAG